MPDVTTQTTPGTTVDAEKKDIAQTLVVSASPDDGADYVDIPGGEDEATRQAYYQLCDMTQEEYDEFDRKTLRKCDIRIVPWMTLLYLMSFLDRINIGTAKLAGLGEDLNMTPGQFNNVTVILFASYVFFELPSNLILKKMRPSRWIPLIVILWAIVQICMGVVTNYDQLMALRFLLGMFESGLFPGISFLLTGWYRRREASKRISIFFAGAVLAGAFGGVLGYGLSQMDGIGGKRGWSWIFIIEGLLTLIVGIASPWMVQDFPEQATFLTPLERANVLYRLKADSGLNNEGTFSWRVFKRAVLDWKTWVMMVLYIGASVPLYSMSIFAPTIIRALGTWTTAQSMLLSTPPYAWAFITTVATAYYSDKLGRRAIFVSFWTVVLVVGYILFLTVPRSSSGALYFAIFLTLGAISPCIAITIAWAGNTFGNHYKKATSMGIIFSLGSSGGIIASMTYRAEDSPKYVPGHAVSLGFSAAACISVVILWFGLARQNRIRDAKYGPVEEQKVSKPTYAHDTDANAGEGEKGLAVTRHQADVTEEYKERWGLQGMSREEIVELGDDHPAHRFIL